MKDISDTLNVRMKRSEKELFKKIAGDAGLSQVDLIRKRVFLQEDIILEMKEMKREILEQIDQAVEFHVDNIKDQIIQETSSSLNDSLTKSVSKNVEKQLDSLFWRIKNDEE